MAKTNPDPSRRVSFHVSTKERPQFSQPLVAYVFDPRGALIERAEVKGDTVDNNRCFAEIHPVAGTVTPDPVCGFHYYSSPSDVTGLSFTARHPNRFATYAFTTERGTGPAIPDASTAGGVSGDPGIDGFTQVAAFTYSKNVTVATLIGPCSNAAFSERLDVYATATNGYTTLTGYNRWDNAAFALAVPCPPCECDDKDKKNNP